MSALGTITVPVLLADPVETPEAGKVFLYIVSNSYRMKVSSGTVFTFATGISAEDVEDIVGSLIQAGSTKISANYNDPSNALVLDVVTANILHQELSGAGTNTHAQIDSHIANNSNPHATTAAQVGAYTSGQVDTLLSNKYDVSNPSGFETPAQLNTRDTNNRNRSNHTGTQLASTISNFATTVLATILSGFVVGANVAVSATDTILQAFGKIQGQLNQIFSVLSTLVLGDNFENFVDNTTFTTTSTTNVAAASFTSTLKQSGLYRLGVCWNWRIASTNSDAIFGIYIDGVLQDIEFRKEPQEANNQNFPFTWFTYVNFATATTHTIELRVRNEAGGVTTTVFVVNVEMWRVS